MDLDYYQRSDLRKYFLSQYMKKSKDQSLEELVYFLMCYKACVRAKVSFFRVKEEGNSKKECRILKRQTSIFIWQHHILIYSSVVAIIICSYIVHNI
jgi:aminoglycoside phosphotransferase family enzyme